MVMHLIWVQKIVGSSPAAPIAESHNGSVGACKVLGKGSIPFSAYLNIVTGGREADCGGFENRYTKVSGVRIPPCPKLP